MKYTEEQMKEIEEVVVFTADGKMHVENVTGDVGNVYGNVRGDVRGSVWGGVDGNVGGSVRGGVKGDET